MQQDQKVLKKALQDSFKNGKETLEYFYVRSVLKQFQIPQESGVKSKFINEIS